MENELFAIGNTKVYEGEYLGAISIPIGGIGAGCIQLDGKCRLAIWQIFNNFKHISIPHSFFAVRIKTETAGPVVRAMQTEPIGPFSAVSALRFSGEYPFAWYDFLDPELPIKVSLEAYSPFIPLNARDSSIPCAIFNLTAENNSSQKCDISFLASQQNAVGIISDSSPQGRVHKDYGRNLNWLSIGRSEAILHMSSEKSRESPGFGDMALIAIHPGVLGTASWTEIQALYDEYYENGFVSGPCTGGPTEDRKTLNGALTVPFSLNPGEKRTVKFVLTWHFPNVSHGHGSWGANGNYYSNFWPGALQVALEMKERVEELESDTRLYHKSFYDSNLPHWLLDRISSQTATLRSKTCFWARDGYFGAWEGCSSGSGCCSGNCNHVWHYAQAHARLFPEIARRMRDQAFYFITEEGWIPHRQYHRAIPAADGQFGDILGAYREHLVSKDDKWLLSKWKYIKAAIDYSISAWDSDEDGMMCGRQWNTLDDALGGCSSWIGSLYLAALAACEKMADIAGDPESARRYRSILESGMEKQNETLWNGEYYFQIPDSEPNKDYNNGCHIDQVLGQWWAHQLDLGWIYPPERVATALKFLKKYNYQVKYEGLTQAPRKFVDDNDAGMQMITWPHGGRPLEEHTIYYADEVMSGFEYSAAATMVQCGLIEEGFIIVKAVYDRYDGRLRSSLSPGDNASWGFSGNPFGDDECGKFYARAMSVWSLLLACQGFIYDGPNGKIGFKPVWKPEDHRSFFTAAEGWGIFHQKKCGNAQKEEIELRYGRLDLKSLVFDLLPGVRFHKAVVTIDGKVQKSESLLDGNECKINLARTTTLNKGGILRVEIN